MPKANLSSLSTIKVKHFQLFRPVPGREFFGSEGGIQRRQRKVTASPAPSTKLMMSVTMESFWWMFQMPHCC